MDWEEGRRRSRRRRVRSVGEGEEGAAAAAVEVVRRSEVDSSASIWSWSSVSFVNPISLSSSASFTPLPPIVVVVGGPEFELDFSIPGSPHWNTTNLATADFGARSALASRANRTL